MTDRIVRPTVSEVLVRPLIGWATLGGGVIALLTLIIGTVASAGSPTYLDGSGLVLVTVLAALVAIIAGACFGALIGLVMGLVASLMRRRTASRRGVVGGAVAAAVMPSALAYFAVAFMLGGGWLSTNTMTITTAVLAVVGLVVLAWMCDKLLKHLDRGSVANPC